MSGNTSTAEGTQNAFKCANLEQDGEHIVQNCQNHATKTCGSCYLVKYCSRECQLKHWPLHKAECKHEMRKSTWQPDWVKERRQPAFAGPSLVPFVTFGDRRFLWGNVPAYDVLNLANNESSEHARDVRICFAASGDMRNVMETLNGIPVTHRGICTSIINDKDNVVVARNVVLLLTAFTVALEDAVELILHLWYSARLTLKMINIVSEEIRPLIADVVGKVEMMSDNTIQSKTWSWNHSSLTVRLYKYQWIFVLRMLDSKPSIAETEASRKFVVLNEARKDYRHRHHYNLTPPMRLCAEKLRETGILLPFGHCTSDFVVANPTLFDTDTGEWLQKDSANIINGYEISKVLAFENEYIPIEDINARLYAYIHTALEKFVLRTRRMSLRFLLYGINATALPSTLPKAEAKFDRIEVSNIADTGWIGFEAVLSTLGPMLKPPKENPHATLITLFINATHVADQALGNEHKKTRLLSEMKEVRKYLQPVPHSWHYDPAFIQFSSAKDIVRDNESLFQHWMQMIDAKGIAARAGMVMREKHKVIEKWPVGLVDGEKDFFLLLKSGSNGDERYVEWVRKE